MNGTLDELILHNIAAFNIIMACFDTVMAISRFPGVGVFLFMLQRVCLSIFRFFATYLFHFLGYAIAFHIIMPKDGAFLSLTDSMIKVSEYSEIKFNGNSHLNSNFLLSRSGNSFLRSGHSSKRN